MNTTTEEIIALYRKHGHESYGENMSQISHAVQAGLIAKAKGFDSELIAAAFLHDIGHICPMEMQQEFGRMGDFGVDAHDKWGELYLKAKGFSDRLIATVRNHVDAKRYLCYADVAYFEQLSDASKQTMTYQGGVMSEKEAKIFERKPFFEDSIHIRRIDEEAKVSDFEITAQHWTYFSELVESIQKN